MHAVNQINISKKNNEFNFIYTQLIFNHILENKLQEITLKCNWGQSFTTNIPTDFPWGEIAVLKAGKYHKYIKKLQIVQMHSHFYMSHKHSFTGTVLSLSQNQVLP